MKIQVVFLGKTKNPHLAALCEEYRLRLHHYVPCETKILREDRKASRSRQQPLTESEEKRLLEHIAAAPRTILLDVGGTELDTESFTGRVRQHLAGGTRRLDFIAGGPWGWTAAIRAAVHERWTLSRLTLAHELARVVLLEQLYRSLSRLHGSPYDK